MNYVPKLNRRSFVITAAAAGGGLALGLDLPFGGPQSGRAPAARRSALGSSIKPDDTVVIRVVRSEMGQGTVTGLCQLVAEELECNWDEVTMGISNARPERRPQARVGRLSTGGSRGIRMSHQYVRAGGAAAREMLTQAAANEWNVPVSEVAVDKGVITHKGSNRTTTYGKVAEAASKLDVPQRIPLKDPKDWTIAGKPLKRLDTADKVIGKMVYGMDVKFPGMLNAAVKACPVFGGNLKSFDESKVAGMPGVKKVVRVNDSAVAVVADTWWQAKTALDALPIVWDEGENAKVSSESIAAWLKEGLDAPEAFVGNSNGDAKATLAGAVKKVEAVYSYPIRITPAWSRSTRPRSTHRTSVRSGPAPRMAKQRLARRWKPPGLPASKCDVYKTILGGGFGRRGRSSDYVRRPS